MKLKNLTHIFGLTVVLTLPLQHSLSAKTMYTIKQASQILASQKLTVELTSLLSLKSVNSEASTINRWLSDSSIEPLYKEKLLYETTLIFRNKRANATYKQLMNKLVTYQSEAYLPLNDGGYNIAVAAFQVAASAKATLIHWQIDDTFSSASSILSSDPVAFLDRLAPMKAQDVDLHGYIKALNEATTTELSAIVSIIKLQQLQIPSRALITLAEQTEDKDLYQILIEQYQPDKQLQSIVIHAISNLPEPIPETDKITLLSLASLKDDLADAAILSLTPYVDKFSRVADLMHTLLSDPQNGGSAAKVLSKSEDLLTLEKLAANLTHGDSLKARRSLLALHLNNSYRAKTILLAFQKTTTNPQLKREVEQWLQ
jgi:hypothetical protein